MTRKCVVYGKDNTKCIVCGKGNTRDKGEPAFYNQGFAHVDCANKRGFTSKKKSWFW